MTVYSFNKRIPDDQKGICRFCGEPLIVGENCSDSAWAKKDRTCRTCNAKKMQTWRYENAERYEDIKAREREKYQGEKEERAAWQKEYKDKNPLKYYFNKTKNQSGRRGFSFELSREQFASFWQKPCTYCGDSIRTIGLDRVDSSMGYEMGNVTPCCIICNKMKNNYSLDFFISHCKKIIEKGK